MPVDFYDQDYVAQWFEAAKKVHDEQTAIQMLSGIEDYYSVGTTGMHIAAKYDHDLIAAQLLTEDPNLADAVNAFGWDALRMAVLCHSPKVVTMLLAKTPHVIHAASKSGETALHLAAGDGWNTVVAQLLTADPNLANVGDISGWRAIHYAAFNDQEATVDMLLAVNPQLIFSDTRAGQTVLEMACESRSRNKAFFARLLALHPHISLEAPFAAAVSHDNDSAIELLQWKLTFDEIVRAFTKHDKSFEGRLRPIVEGQCACLVESLLNRDVVGIVFEYLGFRGSETKQKTAGLA